MSFIAVAIAGSALVGAGASIYSSTQAQKAASQQVSAEQSAIQTQQQMESPFINASTSVLPTLQQLLTPGPNQTAALSQIPGYQFLLSQGLQGVQAGGTTRGLGGNVMAAGANYATGTAQNAFNSIVNPLLSIYGTGASAAGSAANSISSAQVGIGNAQAAGTTGAASALTGGATNATSSLSNLALLKSLISGSQNPSSSWAGQPAGTPLNIQPANYTGAATPNWQDLAA